MPRPESTDTETALTSLAELEELVVRLVTKAELKPALPVRWNRRLRTSMGRAKCRLDKGRWVPVAVEFNPRLWARATPAERRETVIHEVAHIIANVRHQQSCGHDARWQAVMVELGGSLERCHKVEASDMRLARIEKACPSGCGWTMHRSRAGWTRLRKKTRTHRFTCPQCREAIPPHWF